MAAAKIGRLAEIVGGYDALLCDVWGVIHNGVAANRDACAALAAARRAGKAVILVTNSPRPRGTVQMQLDRIGVPREAYDAMATSGDVTRDLIAAGPRRVLHIGEERDLSIFDGLDVELVEEAEAQAVVCSGPYDDENDAPEDYLPLLQRLRGRNLPFVCANPDIVVERGDKLVWCAGAIARDYARLGGRTLIAGKPHRPIYDNALALAAETLKRPVAAARCLAIGDGVLTDAKGATDNGVDLLYIAEGVHARDYSVDGVIDPARLDAFLDSHGQHPVAWMERLA